MIEKEVTKVRQVERNQEVVTEADIEELQQVLERERTYLEYEATVRANHCVKDFRLRPFVPENTSENPDDLEMS
jgi:hypothetical protein